MPDPSRPVAASRSLLSRRRMLSGTLAGGVALAAGPLLTACDPPPAYPYRNRPANPCNFGYDWPRPHSERHLRDIMWPVLGSNTWTDTYMAPRGSGGCRFHEGADIMGPKMLKLLACVDGTIVELRHRATGNMLIIRDSDGYHYCYLHINDDDPGTNNGANRFQHAFAPGMAVGRTVRRGDHVAYLGDSGNAGVPHLHFEIRVPNSNMWRAAAVDPAPSLRQAQAASERSNEVPASTFAPFGSARALVLQQGRDLLANRHTTTWTNASTEQLRFGAIAPDAFIHSLLGVDQITQAYTPTLRLYQAFFGGIPERNGVNHWAHQILDGQTQLQVAEHFAGSTKFRSQYGNLDDRAFCAQILRNAHLTEPTGATVDARVAQLRSGVTRGRLVQAEVNDSATYRNAWRNRVRVITLWHCMLGISPTQASLNHWIPIDRNSGTGLQTLVAAIRRRADYAARVTS